MFNGDDVLDNWEEIDEAGLCMTLQTKLQTTNNVNDDDISSTKFKAAQTTDVAGVQAGSKMKLLQRPQSLQESGGETTTVVAVAPKQIMIAKKPASVPTLNQELSTAPVMMVLHKSNSEYDGVNYVTPICNQTVKILRRPAQAAERRDTNGMRPKQPIKTLQQREQEYAQARLRILGSAKNPEDDKPHATTAPAVLPTPVQVEQTPPASKFNNNNNYKNCGIVATAPGMHRSNSAPKMSQTAPIYNNYSNYYQAGPTPATMGYYYQQQHTLSSAFQQQQQTPPHYNQRMSPYVAAAAAGASALQTPNTQQSWSPVVGGSVSAALLRQQSLHTSSLQQHQHQVPPTPPPYANPYNDNVLRLPRGPCPNGTIGFQMRR